MNRFLFLLLGLLVAANANGGGSLIDLDVDLGGILNCPLGIITTTLAHLVPGQSLTCGCHRSIL